MIMAAGQPLMLQPHSLDTLRRRQLALRHAWSFSRCSGFSCFPWMLLAVCILAVSEESSAMPATTMGGQETTAVELSTLHDTGDGAVVKLEVGEARLAVPRADMKTPTETVSYTSLCSEATPSTQSDSDDGPTPAAATPSSTRPHTSPLGEAADSRSCTQTGVGSEATHTIRPHSNDSRTPAAATLSSACLHTPTLHDVAVSHLRSLSGEEKGKRLRQAARDGKVEEVRALLAAGADARARGVIEWTALHYTAYWGHVEAARCLLQAGAEVDARTRGRWTPLNLAAQSGQAAAVRLLLAACADINASDGNGWTPLHWAATKGHAEAATALLEAGADKGARTVSGRTPLDFARVNNHQQLIQILET